MQVASYLFIEECSLSGDFRNMKYTAQHMEVSEILSTLEAKEKVFLVWEGVSRELVSLVFDFFARKSNCVIKVRLVLQGCSDTVPLLIITWLPLSIPVFNEGCCMRHHCLNTI